MLDASTWSCRNEWYEKPGNNAKTGSRRFESQGAGWKSADSRAQPPRERMRGATTRRLKMVRRAAPIPLPCKRLPKLPSRRCVLLYYDEPVVFADQCEWFS
jgi:hypothetical protein